MKYFYTILLLFCTCTANAIHFPITRGPHHAYIGPEIYYTKRTREGGSKQDGILYGFRAGYDRIRRSALYWGIDGFHARGDLSGRSSSGKKLESNKTDSQVEGRFGYTWKKHLCKNLILTPYVGYGYFYGRNKFRYTSPMKCFFHNHFDYFAAGFLSQTEISSCLTAGIHFKAKYMNDGKSKITNDPLYENVTLIINSGTHYEVDIPLTYQFCMDCKQYRVSLTPFYRFRRYGGRENYPFDFYETKYQIWGGRLVINYDF